MKTDLYFWTLDEHETNQRMKHRLLKRLKMTSPHHNNNRVMKREKEEKKNEKKVNKKEIKKKEEEESTKIARFFD